MGNQKILHSLLVIAIVAVVAGAGYFSWQLLQSKPPPGPGVGTGSAGVAKFASAQEFTAYLDSVQGLGSGSAFAPVTSRDLQFEDVGAQLGLGAVETGGPTVDRMSQTNVQVQGLDEPDIVKTDGTNLFVSSEQEYYYNFDDVVPLKTDTVPPAADESSTEPSTGSGTTGTTPASPLVIRPQPVQATTKVVRALPLETLGTLASIEASGDLLLSNNTLVVFPNRKIIGYDVTDPAKPVKAWTAELGGSRLVSARLFQGQVFVATETYIQGSRPCPLDTLSIDGQANTIPCTEIFHPIAPVPTDTTYAVLVLDAKTGQIVKKTSFLGSSSSTVVYVSAQAVYITYSVYTDPVVTQYDFLTTELKDLLPAAVLGKIQRLQAYDLSRQAKLVELQTIIDQWQGSLSSDAATKLQADMDDRLQVYQLRHQRDLESTEIIKVSLDDLAVAATGRVPGHVLNQFALDEYQNVLRLATTSGGGWFGTSESVNDVYTLGPDLKLRGQLLDLGKGERIYSARFVGHVGYLVTFKQIDPFFVLDLSDPGQPKQVGELKIPGFSSYLHPLTDKLVLGVGQEESKTKVALFDVSDPAAPAETSKLLLDYGWSEIQTNHHAFLQDSKHEVVFLPAGTKGQVLAYKNQTLTTVKTVEDIQAKRAVYINDYLYVIGSEKIVVLNESSWQVEKELVL